MRVLRRAGIEVPETRATPPRAVAPRQRWLLKPGAPEAATGLRSGVPAGRLARQHYLQERVAGIAGSVTFLADGRRALVLGISRQLVGEREFGGRSFRYCGSLLGRGLFDEEPALLGRAGAMAEAVTREFGLVGLNGIDFIARAGVPWPIEVNPRYSASMELLERAADISLFALHADACGGRLPAAPAAAPRRVHGKAIVFARRGITAGDTRGWLRDLSDRRRAAPGRADPAWPSDLHRVRVGRERRRHVGTPGRQGRGDLSRRRAGARGAA